MLVVFDFGYPASLALMLNGAMPDQDLSICPGHPSTILIRDWQQL
jgi:hypothetical protein